MPGPDQAEPRPRWWPARLIRMPIAESSPFMARRADAGVSVITSRRRNAARDGEGRRGVCELTERDTRAAGRGRSRDLAQLGRGEAGMPEGVAAQGLDLQRLAGVEDAGGWIRRGAALAHDVEVLVRPLAGLGVVVVEVEGVALRLAQQVDDGAV